MDLPVRIGIEIGIDFLPLVKSHALHDSSRMTTLRKTAPIRRFLHTLPVSLSRCLRGFLAAAGFFLQIICGGACERPVFDSESNQEQSPRQPRAPRCRFYSC